jgi:hypothetical protein
MPGNNMFVPVKADDSRSNPAIAGNCPQFSKPLIKIKQFLEEGKRIKAASPESFFFPSIN